MEPLLHMSEFDRRQEMTQYLLGALPEADTERFDALSVADSDFADELNATEKNLVDAYVAGELTGATLERFEAHYLASPLRREKVEFARSFHGFAERHWATRASEGEVARRPATSFAAISTAFRDFQQRLVWRWSLAAAAVILLAMGGWWTFHDRANGEGNELVATLVLAPPLRGSERVPSLLLPKKTGMVEVQLEMESDEYAAYRVTLVDESGDAELWRSSSASASAAGVKYRLAVRFPAQLIKSQIYSLVVTGVGPQGNTEVIANYPFRAQVE